VGITDSMIARNISDFAKDDQYVAGGGIATGDNVVLSIRHSVISENRTSRAAGSI
jgi:hypothetical protein